MNRDNSIFPFLFSNQDSFLQIHQEEKQESEADKIARDAREEARAQEIKIAKQMAAEEVAEREAKEEQAFRDAIDMIVKEEQAARDAIDMKAKEELANREAVLAKEAKEVIEQQSRNPPSLAEAIALTKEIAAKKALVDEQVRKERQKMQLETLRAKETARKLRISQALTGKAIAIPELLISQGTLSHSTPQELNTQSSVAVLPGTAPHSTPQEFKNQSSVAVFSGTIPHPTPQELNTQSSVAVFSGTAPQLPTSSSVSPELNTQGSLAVLPAHPTPTISTQDYARDLPAQDLDEIVAAVSDVDFFSSSSDSSSDSDSEPDTEKSNKNLKAYDEFDEPDDPSALKTKNEITVIQVSGIAESERVGNIDEKCLVALGSITSVVDSRIVCVGIASGVLDVGVVVYEQEVPSDQVPLTDEKTWKAVGRIVDVFGRVTEPFYCIAVFDDLSKAVIEHKATIGSAADDITSDGEIGDISEVAVIELPSDGVKVIELTRDEDQITNGLVATLQIEPKSNENNDEETMIDNSVISSIQSSSKTSLKDLWSNIQQSNSTKPICMVGRKLFYLSTMPVVDIEPLKLAKGTDASNLFDEEADAVDFSDDEKEREAKKGGKKGRNVDENRVALNPCELASQRLQPQQGEQTFLRPSPPIFQIPIGANPSSSAGSQRPAPPSYDFVKVVDVGKGQQKTKRPAPSGSGKSNNSKIIKKQAVVYPNYSRGVGPISAPVKCQAKIRSYTAPSAKNTLLNHSFSQQQQSKLQAQIQQSRYLHSTASLLSVSTNSSNGGSNGLPVLFAPSSSLQHQFPPAQSQTAFVAPPQPQFQIPQAQAPSTLPVDQTMLMQQMQMQMLQQQQQIMQMMAMMNPAMQQRISGNQQNLPLQTPVVSHYIQSAQQIMPNDFYNSKPTPGVNGLSFGGIEKLDRMEGGEE